MREIERERGFGAKHLRFDGPKSISSVTKALTDAGP